MASHSRVAGLGLGWSILIRWGLLVNIIELYILTNFRPIRGQDIIIWRRLSKSTTKGNLLPAKPGNQVLGNCK